MPRPDDHKRPAEPSRDGAVWYLGWEISWNPEAFSWSGYGWDAYKGGADIDAPRIQAETFDEVLYLIEEEEEYHRQ